MFVEIKHTEGKDIFRAPTCVGNCCHHVGYSPLLNSFILNLMQVKEVYFGKFEKTDLDAVTSRSSINEEWLKMIGSHYIGFYAPEENSFGESFTLFFKGGGMSEYQRIKRIIDENTWK